jgi:hypothetical protein
VPHEGDTNGWPVCRRQDEGAGDNAYRLYQQALALAEELDMRPLQAHCHLGLGTLYATTGRQEQDRTALPSCE